MSAEKLVAFNAGRLRHSLDILKPISISNGSGGKTKTYETQAAIRCAIDPITVSTRDVAKTIREGAIRDVPLYTLIMRYHPELDITSKWRFSWTSPLWSSHPNNTRVFKIETWPQIMDERRRYVAFIVSEVTQLGADTTS